MTAEGTKPIFFMDGPLDGSIMDYAADQAYIEVETYTDKGERVIFDYLVKDFPRMFRYPLSVASTSPALLGGGSLADETMLQFQSRVRERVGDLPDDAKIRLGMEKTPERIASEAVEKHESAYHKDIPIGETLGKPPETNTACCETKYAPGELRAPTIEERLARLERVVNDPIANGRGLTALEGQILNAHTQLNDLRRELRGVVKVHTFSPS